MSSVKESTTQLQPDDAERAEVASEKIITSPRNIHGFRVSTSYFIIFSRYVSP